MFETTQSRGIDQLLALMQAYQADPRDNKVDLVVGVYKDAEGNIPVMRAVKAAEKQLYKTETTKTYVGISGAADYRALVPALLLGADSQQVAAARVISVQTPGGSGALKVACDYLNMLEAGKTLWVSSPTWANHIPVAQDAGLSISEYPYFRASDRGLDFEGMVSHLKSNAKPGDAILLHACCHNPTGVDPSFEQWQILADLVLDLQLLPFLDCAYQGLGESMTADVAGLRHMAGLVPEMLIASSFSKNFGIYRERTGALTVIAVDQDDLQKAHGGIETVVRSNYSMPPSHGARIVSTVFENADQKLDWEQELREMRDRIASMRHALKSRVDALGITADTSFLTAQKGMFSYTGFGPDAVARLKTEFGVYMAGDGRINVAGLTRENIDVVAHAFSAILKEDA